MKSSPRFHKKDSYRENYTKKIMQEKVGNLRDMIERLVKSGKHLKEKFHLLFVELQPFFRHIEHCDSSKIEKY
jgi:chemotaxis methyl-accepting protein methylase